MQFKDRVSTLLREMFTMNPKALPTEAQLVERMADAEAKLAEAQLELARTESELAEGSAAASIDDLALKRLDKKLEEARAKVRRWEEQIARLAIVEDQLIRATFEARQRESVAKAQAISDEAVRLAAEIDRRVDDLAADIVRINKLHSSFIETLPIRPRHIPPVLTPGTFAYLISARMFAVCGDFWSQGVSQRMTRHEARQFPSLESRIKTARGLVLSETNAPGPEAA